MRDPAFAALREAPVPDRFDSQMARLRAAPRHTHSPAKAAVLVFGLVLVAAACAVPVSVQSPLGYSVRWAVAGVAGEEHTSAQALEASVPEADRLVTAVDPGVDSTQFQYVVAGPKPDTAPLRADTTVREVRVEAITEPVRVPLGVWTLQRLGASRTVQVGTVRLGDARVQRLLTGQLAETGIDTSSVAFTVGRTGAGLRTIRIRARTSRDGSRSETTLPVGAGTLVRVQDGLIAVSGLPRGARLDSAIARHVRMGRPVVALRQGSDGRTLNLADVDSVLRARGLDARTLDGMRRTPDNVHPDPEQLGALRRILDAQRADLQRLNEQHRTLEHLRRRLEAERAAPERSTVRRLEFLRLDSRPAETPAPRAANPSPRP